MSDKVELRFEKFCDQATLSDEIVASIGADRLVGAVVNEDDDQHTLVRLPYNATNEEKAAVAACVESHDTIHAARNMARRSANLDCRTYIYRHYTQPQQASLTILMVEGIALGYGQRVQYIGQALAWVKAVIGYYYAKKDEINATGDIEAVDAVSWDFAVKFDDQDPGVTIREATNIES